ncbi:MAG: TIGR03915 family putative DNA repair protein [Muricauda sp.]|nr:TIGR03915 family putative DNA repair protein [Allomuricauda sp.]MBA4743957.1 TIGR03915 family putative DNA repair protein [Allomuricauda sp.]
MEPTTTLIYDGSFNGFLTAIFIAFDEKIDVADIQKNNQSQSGLFSDTETVFTNVEKAERVWNGIRNKSHNAISNIYFAFLSEAEGVELMLYTYIQKLMRAQNGKYLDYSDSTVVYIGQLAKKVGREKHRMETFVQFQLSKDDIYFANIEPDFDVLPLISKHFRGCYADQQWLIYDVKRKYGIFYNLDHVEMVSLNLKDIHHNKTVKSDAFAPNQTLWNDYFKSTNVASYINPKLHTQHIPKRNWKYLGEKREAV